MRMTDADLIEILGLSGLVSPPAGRDDATAAKRVLAVPVEDGLASMASDIDRATRAWLDGDDDLPPVA